MKIENFEGFVTSIPECYGKMGGTGSNRQIWLFSLIQVFLLAEASFPWYSPSGEWGGGGGTGRPGTSNTSEPLIAGKCHVTKT